MFDYYATPGSGRLFLKDINDANSQSYGATVRSALHGQRSEHVFKMAAHVSSTSSVEMASSSEDSASEDPINIAKGRGADLKEPEKAEIARTRKVQRNKAGGKKTLCGQKDPKVSAYKRVSENRNEFLNVTSKNMLM